MMKYNQKNLWIYTLLAIVLGGVVGRLFPEFMMSIEVVGKLFVGLLKMIVIPLVLTAVVSSILGLGSADSLKQLGWKTVLLYFFTTVFAVIFADIIVSLVDVAGTYTGAVTTDYVASKRVETISVGSLIMSFVPVNIFQSLTANSMAQIVTFSIFFGIAGLFVKEQTRNTLFDITKAINDVMIRIANFIVMLTPIGVFSLIGKSIGNIGMDAIISLWFYFLVVVLGLLFIAFVFHPILLVLAGYNLREHYKVAKDQLIVAFSSATSVGTLPVTMQCAEKLKVDKKVAGFSLPLGATANMSGTSFYVIVAIMFVGQISGHQFDFSEIVYLSIMVVVLSIGISGTPGASLVAIVLVLNALNLPVEYISIILVVDRLLDQFRTAVNVHDDLVISRLLTVWNKK